MTDLTGPDEDWGADFDFDDDGPEQQPEQRSSLSSSPVAPNGRSLAGNRAATGVQSLSPGRGPDSLEHLLVLLPDVGAVDSAPAPSRAARQVVASLAFAQTCLAAGRSLRESGLFGEAESELKRCVDACGAVERSAPVLPPAQSEADGVSTDQEHCDARYLVALCQLQCALVAAARGDAEASTAHLELGLTAAGQNEEAGAPDFRVQARLHFERAKCAEASRRPAVAVRAMTAALRATTMLPLGDVDWAVFSAACCFLGRYCLAELDKPDLAGDLGRRALASARRMATATKALSPSGGGVEGGAVVAPAHAASEEASKAAANLLDAVAKAERPDTGDPSNAIDRGDGVALGTIESRKFTAVVVPDGSINRFADDEEEEEEEDEFTRSHNGGEDDMLEGDEDDSDSDDDDEDWDAEFGLNDDDGGGDDDGESKTASSMSSRAASAGSESMTSGNGATASTSSASSASCSTSRGGGLGRLGGQGLGQGQGRNTTTNSSSRNTTTNSSRGHHSTASSISSLRDALHRQSREADRGNEESDDAGAMRLLLTNIGALHTAPTHGGGGVGDRLGDEDDGRSFMGGAGDVRRPWLPPRAWKLEDIELPRLPPAPHLFTRFSSRPMQPSMDAHVMPNTSGAAFIRWMRCLVDHGARRRPWERLSSSGLDTSTLQYAGGGGIQVNLATAAGQLGGSARCVGWLRVAVSKEGAWGVLCHHFVASAAALGGGGGGVKDSSDSINSASVEGREGREGGEEEKAAEETRAARRVGLEQGMQLLYFVARCAFEKKSAARGVPLARIKLAQVLTLEEEAALKAKVDTARGRCVQAVSKMGRDKVDALRLRLFEAQVGGHNAVAAAAVGEGGAAEQQELDDLMDDEPFERLREQRESAALSTIVMMHQIYVGAGGDAGDTGAGAGSGGGDGDGGDGVAAGAAENKDDQEALVYIRACALVDAYLYLTGFSPLMLTAQPAALDVLPPARRLPEKLMILVDLTECARRLEALLPRLDAESYLAAKASLVLGLYHIRETGNDAHGEALLFQTLWCLDQCRAPFLLCPRRVEGVRTDDALRPIDVPSDLVLTPMRNEIGCGEGEEETEEEKYVEQHTR